MKPFLARQPERGEPAVTDLSPSRLFERVPFIRNVTPVGVSQLVSLPEAKLLLKEDDELIKEVFDYWSRKRKNSKANSLIPTVKQEKRDGSSTSDPYVAFRRRTEKMQTRKVGRLHAQFIPDPHPGWKLEILCHVHTVVIFHRVHCLL